MAIRGVGGNRNTAYCHALYTYNQIVTYKRGRYGNKNCKTFYKKAPMHLAPGLLIDLIFHEVQPTIHSGCLRHKAMATSVLWGTMTPASFSSNIL